MSLGPSTPSRSNIARYDGSLPYIVSVLSIDARTFGASLVTQTGSVAMIRGAGRLAAFAASVIVGTM